MTRFSVSGVRIAILIAAFISPISQAQGTISFGFEEYALGDEISHIGVQNGPNLFLADAVVADSSTAPFLPYEGQKFLYGRSGIALRSPNGELIKNFEVHIFANNRFAVDKYIGGSEDFGKWTKVTGAFETPSPYVLIGSSEILGQVVEYPYAIDAVTFVTIPEPSVSAVLVLGALGWLCCYSRKR